MGGEELTETWKFVHRGTHEVEARPTVNVNIKEGGGDGCIAKIHDGCICRGRVGSTGGDLGDSSIFYDENWIRELVDWSVEAPCSDYGLHD
jgi:hypothetical protein